MNLFPLKDVFSDRENELFSDNIAKILKKIANLHEDDFIRIFVYYGNASAITLLSSLIFFGAKEASAYNIFEKHSSQLNSDKAFESLKMIICHYSIAFSKNNKNYLESIYLSQEDFKNEIFRIFNYNKEDRQIFNELFELYREEDISRYFVRHYKFLIKKTFNSEDNNFFHSLFFSGMLSSSYREFCETLF